MGINEQIIYPEINIDKLPRISGMDITFVTTAKTNEEAYELLKEMGMPFTNMEKNRKIILKYKVESDSGVIQDGTFEQTKNKLWQKNQ